jgi:hypothetical protein
MLDGTVDKRTSMSPGHRAAGGLVTLQPLPSSLSGRHADRQGVLGE